MQRHRHAAIVALVPFLLASCLAGSKDVRPVPHGASRVPPDVSFGEVFPDRGVQTLEPMPAPEGPARLVARPYEPFLSTWRDPGPGANEAFQLAADNPFGQRVSFLVEDLFRDRDGTDWARILTGEHPNGARAWIRATDVRMASVDQRIVVDLSSHTLTKYVHGDVRARMSVAIGDQDTPTVPGRYFVWARVRYANPVGAYGKLALGLSGFSRVVRFGPSPGRLAIHGTADPSDRGKSISLGCVRVYNSQIGQLWNAPMGTPVIIRR